MGTIIGVLGCVALSVVGQDFKSTWPPEFHPGEDCLAYDGSKVPDCRDFVNPITKEPYYHPHSFNCSRFWECGPTFEVCLFECAHCNNEQMNNPLCKGQQALSFDPTIQWPIGPVCNWPTTIDCDNGEVPCDCQPWQSCVNGKCTPQCTEDSHCPQGYHCDECNWCVADGGETTPTTKPTTPTPTPTTPTTTPTTPTPKPTTSTTTTVDVGCDNDDSNCLSEPCDEPANWPYTTCEYCDVNVCRPGCPDNSLCPSLYPICGHYHGEPHRCGCDTDEDCISLGANFVCDDVNHACTPQGVSGVVKITVRTGTCEGCSATPVEGGLQVTLVNNNVECTSNGLDNLEEMDYNPGKIAIFDGKPDGGNNDGLGGCMFADLNVGLTGGTATWTGQGTWTGQNGDVTVCVDFYGDSKPTFCCGLQDQSLDEGITTDLINCNYYIVPPSL